MEQIIREKQDMTYLSWAKYHTSSGAAGSFLKSYSDLGGKKTYYKLSNYDSVRGITGHECVNEIIADRLLTRMGIEHLHYSLIHADVLLDGKLRDVWLCASDDFKKTGESKLALDAYYQAERAGPEESPLDFCIRNGWEKNIYEMLLVDYIILNRDRHGANIEVLRSRRDRTIRLAPLFDHGLSFVFRCETETDLNAFDIMSDMPVQSFIGSRSAAGNLRLIPKEKRPRLTRLSEDELDRITDVPEEALPAAWRIKIREMIRERWKTYEDICDKG